MNNIIISRFNEDIEWIDLINKEKFNFIIYNKGENNLKYESIKLENIGRESHTFLFYIIHNYHNLPEWNIFLQGEPFYACTDEYRSKKNILYDGVSINVTKHSRNGISYKNYLDLINKNDFFGFNLIKFLDNDLYETGIGDAMIGGERFKPEKQGRFSKNYKLFFLKKISLNKPTFTFMAGAQYCVNKNSILKRSLEFYQKCYQMHYHDQEFPWEMERYWAKIFFTNDETIC